MPPLRSTGRASKACAACRKQKTRCYESEGRGGACLRCETLGQTCSLEEERGVVRRWERERDRDWERDRERSPGGRRSVGREGRGERAERDAGGSGDERIRRLEDTVRNLVHRLESTGALRDPAHDSYPPPPPPPPHTHHTPPATHNMAPADRQSSYGPTPTTTTSSAAPVLVIRDVATELGVEARERGDTRSHSPPLAPGDIISAGLISLDDAAALLALFHEHYGRWVYLDPPSSPASPYSPSTTTNPPSPASLVATVRRSPLLLCACCLIAVRHTSQPVAAALAPRLFREAKTLLTASLLTVPQGLDFFQATLVLSLWSTTIGQRPLSVDSWLISGFALQHGLASGLFEAVVGGDGAGKEDEGRRWTKQELDRWCIWNHLCLAHLQYCVGTRRRAIVTGSQIERCRAVLRSDHATNFESRMVAEVCLYWIIYERCCSGDGGVDLPAMQAELHRWRVEWDELFDQPRSQFLQMGFHFAQLVAYDQSLRTRHAPPSTSSSSSTSTSAAVRESLLAEMLRLSAAILDLAMDTTDARTRHLTDNIYHCVTFAAVTICRLLAAYAPDDSNPTAPSSGGNKPPKSLVPAPEAAALDALVGRLVAWLRSIGLPCHVAHTLGDVVDAFHRKLRPACYVAAPTVEASWGGMAGGEVGTGEEIDFAALFPEVFGMGSGVEGFEGWDLAVGESWEGLGGDGGEGGPGEART